MALAAALPCFAQQEENAADVTTLYGRVYLMAERVEAKGGTTTVLARNRVTDQSSLLGVRGTESIGGGWKALFQMETGFNPDGAGGSFAQRNSGVGLTHPAFGTILMGRWDMPFKMAQVAPLDPFTDLALADITGTAINQGNFSNRAQNVIEYWTPNWNGLEAKFGYQANEGKTATVNPYMYGASLVWNLKDFYLTYAYEKHRDMRDGSNVAGVDEVGNGLGGYFRLGGAKLMAQYGTYTRTGTNKQKSFALGIDWVFFGPHHFLAIYQDSKDGGPTNAAQPKCHAYGIGYRYDFSKRTFFTAYYTKVENEIGNLCNFGAATLSITNGADPTGISAGIRHVF
jgi:predicted porin